MKKGGFTMLELIFVIVIIGILAAIAVPRYFALGDTSHEANLKSFVSTLNRTVGEELWSLSMNKGKNGDITDLNATEGASFLLKYMQIPPEINASSINFKNCGNGVYKTIATANVKVAGGEYNVTCKNGTATTAPYFRLIKIENGKTEVLVSRD